MTFDYPHYTYSIPDSWYDGLYKDRAHSPQGCRSFCILHEQKTSQVWLVVHGYRGYPGEMIRPAQDLYNAGFDVYVPRLPGHGSSGRDFVASGASDWIGLVRNAIADLKRRYQVVNVLGHSMGADIMAIVAAPDQEIGKIVYLAPAFNEDFISEKDIRKLRFMMHFRKRIPFPWKSDPRYHMHYENAPCLDQYLGREYWSFIQPRQLIDGLQNIMSQAVASLKANYHDALYVCALDDVLYSLPSASIYRSIYGDRANVVEVPNATHCIQYDIDPIAEETAMKAVIDYATTFPACHIGDYY